MSGETRRRRVGWSAVAIASCALALVVAVPAIASGSGVDDRAPHEPAAPSAGRPVGTRERRADPPSVAPVAPVGDEAVVDVFSLEPTQVAGPVERDEGVDGQAVAGDDRVDSGGVDGQDGGGRTDG